MTKQGEEVLKSPVAEKEEATLQYWKQHKIFEQSVEKPAGAEPVGEFVFLDGPPFATGVPHYGHMIPNSLKDVLPRYKTMKGYTVPRTWGWDCHGLPVENLIEKELGLKVKKDIEEYGIEKFNDAARASVLRYASEWREIIPRLGRWVDMENDYKTMDSSYTESIWWGFKGLHDKGLVSEGYKAMHLCPRCETTLANFEVNQGYKDISDISVYVKCELVDEPGTFVVAWTTTPWTLPGNVALAVGGDIQYAKVSHEGAHYILAKERVQDVIPGAEILEEFPGTELVGKKYKPLFDYYDTAELKNRERGFAIYAADFVTLEDGTGVVHIAPAFGEDDMALGKREQLPFIQHVKTDGQMKPEVVEFAGLQVKPKDDHQSTDVLIIKNLAHRGLLLAKKKIVHSYPHCWRCDTPLLNYATTSWFVSVPKIKDALIANNHQTEWVPEHLRDGRFGKWLEGARDWAISRSRFWGAPLPVWRCADCHETKVMGSFAEIAKPANNTYFIMRHGEAESNAREIVSSNPKNTYHLTEKGKGDVEKSAETLRDKKIDVIIASDFLRTKETAEIVADVLGFSKKDIVHDARLREGNFGVFDDKPIPEYRAQFTCTKDRVFIAPEGGESASMVKDRVAPLLWELEEKYKGKTILLVSHEYPLWALSAAAGGKDAKGMVAMRPHDKDYIDRATVRELPFKQFPHNKKGELDVHRPYIDEVTFSCACGGTLRRVPEVFDCWFESGSMPFAQMHHPFTADASKRMPADFIAEGLDQTRGWFYSLMVLSTALFEKPTFKHLIVNGLLLAEDGQKMSKRLKNYPELDYVFNRYGADALRLFLLGSPLVRAEDASFSERSIDELSKKIILRLENALALYDLGKGESDVMASHGSEHVLDRWIVSRLHQLIREMEENLERYEVDRAVRPIIQFADDFSAWYLRRSRERFKGEDVEDKKAALATTRYVLEEFSKAIAPIAPFLAERLYQHVTVGASSWKGSVHLMPWPKGGAVAEDIVAAMSHVRTVVEQALAARNQAGVKVRQPLRSLRIPAAPYQNLSEDDAQAFCTVIAEEVNIKEVHRDPVLTESVMLDVTLDDELRAEGEYRDLVRLIQDKRKEMGLSPQDKIVLTLNLPQEKFDLVDSFHGKLAQTVGAEKLNMFPEERFSLDVRKV